MSIGKLVSILIMIGLGFISVFVVNEFKDIDKRYKKRLDIEVQKNEEIYFKGNRENLIAEINFYIEKGIHQAAKHNIEKYSKYNFYELDELIIKYCERFSRYKVGNHEISGQDCANSLQNSRLKIDAKKEYISSVVESIERKSAFIYLEGRYEHINNEIKKRLDFPSVFNVKDTWVRPDDSGGVLVLISYEAIDKGKLSTFAALVETKISDPTLEIESIIINSDEVKAKMKLLPHSI